MTTAPRVLLAQATASHIPIRDESVQCVVTSPPYWALRQYAGEQRQVWGGESEHVHEWEPYNRQNERYTGKRKWQHIGVEAQQQGVKVRDVDPNAWGHPQTSAERRCTCGAWYGALGLEPTPELYVEHMVAIFREVRRVLRKDGTLWLNLGDSYAGSWGAQGRDGQMADRSVVSARQIAEHPQFGARTGSSDRTPDLKPKDLVGIPWRVAFALQADGWYLRSDIVWSKPNPMPESVTDRPTKAHEYLFLLSKRERYFYDADAIREGYEPASLERYEHEFKAYGADHPQGAKHGAIRDGGEIRANPLGRNARTVWTIATHPYPGAHFATFPEALVEPCIRAGSRRGDLVHDPFNGSGTTGRVAVREGRGYVGLDLSREYLAEQAVARIDPLAAAQRAARVEEGDVQGVFAL